MEIKSVGVLGCGLMGSGIAEVCARAGLQTTVREVNQEFLDSGMSKLGASLERAVGKGRMSEEDRDATLARLRGTTDVADLADCDLVVEAIIENVDDKAKAFRAVDDVVNKEAIFASNTSSLTITQLAMSTQRPASGSALPSSKPGISRN